MRSSFITILCSLSVISPALGLGIQRRNNTESTCPTDGSALAECKSSKVDARLPPTINPDPSSFSSWVAPPPGWIYGNWIVTYSSQADFLPLINLQFDIYPEFPQSNDTVGKNIDITSFQSANSTTILTEYGIDTPRRSTNTSLGPEWDQVWDFTAPGTSINIDETWEVLAWGYDTCGVGYMVIYEAPADTSYPPGIGIQTRSDVSPSQATLGDIGNALKALGNADITSYVEGLVPLVQNGARRGMGPVVCDAACVNNTGA